jgi:hypothetical protein
MDIYLAAAADSLPPKARTREDRALVPGEDDYYARYASGPRLPQWVGRLLTALRNIRVAGAERVRFARHA